MAIIKENLGRPTMQIRGIVEFDGYSVSVPEFEVSQNISVSEREEKLTNMAKEILDGNADSV